jgi:hypothetical protein
MKVRVAGTGCNRCRPYVYELERTVWGWFKLLTWHSLGNDDPKGRL